MQVLVASRTIHPPRSLIVKSHRSIWAAIAGAIIFALSWLDPVYDRVAAAWERAVVRTRDLWEAACLKVSQAIDKALSLFAPGGVFSVHLQRLADAVKTTYRTWRDRKADHYRAPGSWVSCAST
jgi:hypothetical protein